MRDSRWLWYLRGLMRCNFNQRSAHETCVGEVCAVLLTDDQREQCQKFNEDIIRHPERGVRKMFPTVAETLG